MRIYLDHNATTPVRPEVADAMSAALREYGGNPSSPHAEGMAARRAIERAREQVAHLVGAEPEQVIFTSGATEANNAVLHGVLESAPRARHIVSSTADHPSVAEPLAALCETGALSLTQVPVDEDGRIRVSAFEAALTSRADSTLVSLLLANNETGVLQDAAALAERAHAQGIPVHLDATQAVGKLPVAVATLGADWLVASAHKLNGPKGVGFLVERGTARALPAYLRGGSQEKGRRGGTENLPGIVGLGVACELARLELAARMAQMEKLRDQLWQGIERSVPRVRRNGDAAFVLCNTLNVEFIGCAGDVLLQALDGEGVAVSTGAACHSGSIDPSSVLLAMGRSPEQARASLRFSLGFSNTEAEIERVIALLPSLVRRVRELE